MLTPEDTERYDRQLIMENIGQEGQEKLKQANVFLAGAGGLGSPISLFLAAAGIGKIGCLFVTERIITIDKKT